MPELQQTRQHHRGPDHVPNAHHHQIAHHPRDRGPSPGEGGQREDEHVGDGVLEPQAREARQREPDADRLPEHGASRRGLDNGDADADVAEDGAGEGREDGKRGLGGRHRGGGGRRGGRRRRQRGERRGAGDAGPGAAAPEHQQGRHGGDAGQVPDPARRGPRQDVFQLCPPLQERGGEEEAVAGEELGARNGDREQPDLESHGPEHEALGRRVDGAAQAAAQGERERRAVANERASEHRQRQHPREGGAGLELSGGDGEVPEGGADDTL